MKKVRATSSVLASLLLAGLTMVSFPAEAGMQWKWRDASGAIQYSDRAPPPGTPEKDILARPAASARAAARAAEAAASAASAAAQTAPAPSKALDQELEAKRKKAEEEKAARQKAEDEKIAKAKADNCQRARGYQRTLTDGLRIARTNAKGEREFLDDKARAEEMQRNQEAIAANCN
ncbi:MAG TPA: DUF4124 domain-containing protein [Aquabacterium sp.]|uniref:DUF4124 domain-containing protein n=1 Tax=Aquabacterium sp. TaxID=1872578 RepID=UPI002E35FFF2|nr:DUF4124 domain-containing protein [Aquabacterium sp.]HEX5355323.1 DUF4124 domain-containing protein [Aquabacterium sp.]